jgi:hypothetical protein
MYYVKAIDRPCVRMVEGALPVFRAIGPNQVVILL